MAEETKSRRIRKADWDKVEKHIKGIYDERKDSSFRKKHEEKWKEVDRQIEMEPMRRVDERGKELPPSWHNVVELGELSKASEIITSDVMRIVFPTDKFWFQPHVALDWPVGEDGRPKVSSEKQKVADGLLRSLMNQQHRDFGLKGRFRLSVKESLHHGSFCAEARFEKEMMVKDKGRVKLVGAPVWAPYSMWNTYPDPAPSVIGMNMFYTGSMVLVDYMPLWKLKNIAKGGGWMTERLTKVQQDQEHKVKSGKTKDIELLKFYGDVAIERGDGSILLPNSKVILANGTLVFWDVNELPYPSIIYGGYERQDVRDPYYTSPIIKQSPTQKVATVSTNKFLDAASLKVEPPIEYDGNDPDYVMNDGPSIAPGAKTPTKSMGKGMNALDIGDPSWALKAVELSLRQMQEGTGVSALRSGTTNSDRQTAFEVNKVAQGAEVRTVEFATTLEPCLGSFLHMQHELNRMKMEDYEFYNDEMHTPDVIRAKNKDIQANAYIEVVGTKGILGEEQRTQRTTQVTAFASQNPLFANLLKPDQVLLDMYRDAGKKNPEEWVKTADSKNPQDIAMQAQLQQLQQALAQLIEENKKLQDDHEEKMAKILSDTQSRKEELTEEQRQFNATFAKDRDEFRKELKLEFAKIAIDLAEKFAMAQAGDEAQKIVNELRQTISKQSDNLAGANETIEKLSKQLAKFEENAKKPKRKTGKIKAPSGKVYDVDVVEA